jgi:hypothetical protein
MLWSFCSRESVHRNPTAARIIGRDPFDVEVLQLPAFVSTVTSYGVCARLVWASAAIAPHSNLKISQIVSLPVVF